MKVYSARSAIAINVTVGEQRLKRHLAFMPTSSGGSLLATSDPLLQAAIEAHPRFGSLFRLVSSTADVVPPPVQSRRKASPKAP